MAFNAGEIVARIRATAEGVKAGVGEAKQHIDGLAAGMKKTGQTLSAVGGTMTAMVTGPIVAAGAAFYKLSQQAIGFEQQMNEVFTLLPGISDKAMAEMGSQVKGFAKEFGALPDKVVPALYQSLSAGVPPDNVFAFLEVAQKAAIGGVTDLTTAVDGITSVVNAYGAEVIDAGKASDLMFTAVRLGKTTFQELSGSLYNVLPTAAALGVRFEDVTAAMASMTAQGVPTSVATTQMRQLLVELSKDGGKAAMAFQKLSGESFRDFIANGGNVIEALTLMQEEAKKNNLGINDLFSSVEAGNAALALSGDNALKYAENLREMNLAAGATSEAFDTMESGTGRALEKFQAQWAVLMLELGEKFLPIITDTLVPIFRDDVVPLLVKAAEFVGNLADRFNGLDPNVRKVITGAILLTAGIGPVLLVVGEVIALVGTLTPLLLALKVAFLFIVSPIGLVVAAVAALIAIGILVYKNWEPIKEFFSGLWARVREIFAGAVEGIRERLAWVRDRAREIVQSMWDNTVGRFRSMVDSVKSAFAGITEAILGPIRRARDAVSNIVGSISSTLNRLNPFARQSPSLVDNIRAGIKVIQDEYAKIEDLQIRMPVVGGMQPAMAGAGSATAATVGVVPSLYNGPLIHIENMTVRSDEDIENISRQLHRQIQASTRARGGR